MKIECDTCGNDTFVIVYDNQADHAEGDGLPRRVRCLRHGLPEAEVSMIRFRVNGIPAPQGSKRHVGNGRMVESSKAVGPWREAVRAEAQRGFSGGRGFPDPVALSVTLVFVLARPKSHYSTRKLDIREPLPRLPLPSAPAYPAKRPDLDKLARAVLDGLVAGGVMADDAQVVSLNCAKVYASNGEAPGAIIEVGAM